MLSNIAFGFGVVSGIIFLGLRELITVELVVLSTPRVILNYSNVRETF